MYIGQKDHIAVSLWHQRAPAKFLSTLPHELANETYSDPQNSWVNRFNWDHTFSPNLLNHLSFGYLNRNEGYGSVNQDAVDVLPKIAGVAGQQRSAPDPVQRRLRAMGQQRGRQHRQRHHPSDVRHQRPADVDQERPHDQGRLRVPQHRRQHPLQRQRGGQLQLRPRGHRPPGRQQRQSRSPASCSGRWTTATWTSGRSSTNYPRQSAYIAHVGDTWRVNSKLTVNYGLRWDYFTRLPGEVQPVLLLRSRTDPTPAPADGRAGWPSRAVSTARPATAPTTRRSPTRRRSRLAWA